MVAILGVFWVAGTRELQHTVKAAFPTAFNLTPGLDVQIDGMDVGKIGKVEYKDGSAIVEIGINDDDYWPLPKGTQVTSRWGTTIGSGTRKLDLELGPEDAEGIPEGGIIAAKATQPAVDVDQVVNTLSDDTRDDLQNLQGKLVGALEGNERELNRGLKATGPGVRDVDRFLAELGSDPAALRGLLTNTHRLTQTLAARSGEVAGLISVASQTFGAFADRTQATQATLDGLTPTLNEVTTTLKRVDGSLGGLTALVNDLKPGVRKLPALAKVARPALRDLHAIVPTALRTIRTTTDVAPDVTQFLKDAQPIVDKSTTALKEAKPMMRCLRPYAPEAMGAVIGLAGWTQSFQVKQAETIDNVLLNYPNRHRGRAYNGQPTRGGMRAGVQASTASLHAYPDGIVTPQLYRAIGMKEYAYGRPPGYAAGKPWFIEECGYTKDRLDPSKDSEGKPE
ncbi:MAG: MlaD family protein [Solirubrobacteraceae bacterium]